MKHGLSRREFLLSAALTGAGLACSKPTDHEPIDQSKYLLLRVCGTSVNEYREPDFNSDVLDTHQRDEILLTDGIVKPLTQASFHWYHVRNGYMPSAYLQPVKFEINKPPASLPENGRLAQVSIPFTQSMLLHDHSQYWEPIYRLYYQSNHWVTGIIQGPDGEAWYRIVDHYSRTYYACASHFRMIPDSEISPMYSTLPQDARRIEICISDQTLTAYENDVPIKQCLISSGRHQTEPLKEDEIPTDTPMGNFHITVKTPLRHMGDTPMSDDLSLHAYPGVPWICFFHESGAGLHGAYWHDNFGRRMSSGCVNLKCEDALWLYRWTDPPINPDERQVSGWGTRILVYD